MKTVCELNKCNGCMACIEKCPKQCISIIDSIEYFNAEIDNTKCIGCNICKRICPNNNDIYKLSPILCKQGWAKDDIRSIGSSGGTASSIVKYFIESGGYVAACIFKEGNFVFDITNDIHKAKKFSGSKYVKSNPRGIYSKIEEKLKKNKVLFIGLPCQVSALKRYLSNTDNLYTIDLICHGTPSNKLLEKFLLEKGYSITSIDDIKFRNKNDMGLRIDGKKITKKRVIDEYLCAFLESVNYTENCYSCEYATLDRVSDITLGDSWGTELKDEEKKGVSLILVQTEKGKTLLSNANIELKNVDMDNAIAFNHQLSYPSIFSSKRNNFFKKLNQGCSFSSSVFRVLPGLIIKQKIKSIFFFKSIN